LLAQALQAWKADDLIAAHQLLGRIRQPVLAMPYVRAAQRIIQAQLLNNLRSQARQALQSRNRQ
jgi:hypothetical protein